MILMGFPEPYGVLALSAGVPSIARAAGISLSVTNRQTVEILQYHRKFPHVFRGVFISSGSTGQA